MRGGLVGCDTVRGDDDPPMTASTKFRTRGFTAFLLVSALRLPLVARLTPNMAPLRYLGRSSGRRITLPVAFARVGDTAVVRVAGADATCWWRNFTTPYAVSIRLDGRWVSGVGHVAYPTSLEHEELAAYYQQGFVHCAVPVTDPFVVIELPVRINGNRGTKKRRSGVW